MSQQASSQVVTLEAGTHWLCSSSPYTWWVALVLFSVLLVATARVHGASEWLFTVQHLIAYGLRL